VIRSNPAPVIGFWLCNRKKETIRWKPRNRHWWANHATIARNLIAENTFASSTQAATPYILRHRRSLQCGLFVRNIAADACNRISVLTPRSSASLAKESELLSETKDRSASADQCRAFRPRRKTIYIYHTTGRGKTHPDYCPSYRIVRVRQEHVNGLDDSFFRFQHTPVSLHRTRRCSVSATLSLVRGGSNAFATRLRCCEALRRHLSSSLSPFSDGAPGQ